MKKLKQFLLYLTAIFFFLACDGLNEREKILPPISGKYGEVLVVVDTSFENHETGRAIREIFLAPQVGLPQMETQFRMSTVSPGAFKSILKRGRNIFKLNIKASHKVDLKIVKDVWAKGQLLIQLYAPDDETASRILRKNSQTIRDYFNEEEIKRLQNQHRVKVQKDLKSELIKKYQLSIDLPPSYALMDSLRDGFWIKKEMKVGEHQVMQTLFCSLRNYQSDSVFTSSEMISQRNKFTKKMIKGARQGSYVKVYDEYKPDNKELNMAGIYAMEYRGLWKMENDFMGGPFLHYTLVDEVNMKVIELDGFVYAPKFNKREYLREIEAILKTIKLAPK